MTRMSDSCVEPSTGAALREFDRRVDAVRAVKLDETEWRRMEAYRCPKCDHWHLRPERSDGPIPTDATCLKCSGSDGTPKVSHPTYDDALEQAFSTTGVQLAVYQCPHGRGWHLTKA